jgi:sugar O-acyltransferase (sialic acid O-acetyltransferase NeuD family)
MKKNKKLVIIGDSLFAEVAFEYYNFDSPYEVVGFSVEKSYRKRDELFGLPVVDFETMESHFSPHTHSAFAALTYNQLNRFRERMVNAAKEKGYPLASYISSQSFVWKNVELGEHCFIFEDNTVQPFVRIGNNVILWSGNHIGHHSSIDDHTFISSQVVISGSVTIGKHCFIGVNSTVGNNVNIANDCWIGPGVVINRDTKEGQLFKSPSGEASRVSTYRFFEVSEK